MDHVGFIVSNIDDKGLIRFRALGKVSPQAIQWQRMRLLLDGGSIMGIVGVRPPHFTKPGEEKIPTPIEKMYLDVGAKSRREVEDMGITIGAPFTYFSYPTELANNIIASPAVDNKGGCSAVVVASRLLKKYKTKATIYYVGTVEEEIGLRGADVVLDELDVDMAVAIDTSPAGWQPEVEVEAVSYEIGKGPAIHVGEFGNGTVTIQHHRIRKWFANIAKSEGIPYQLGLHSGHTDARSLMQTKSGTPTAALGLPRKYAHSPYEVFNLDDLNNLVNLLVCALTKLDSGFNLNRV
jgi:endoglucanase